MNSKLLENITREEVVESLKEVADIDPHTEQGVRWLMDNIIKSIQPMVGMGPVIETAVYRVICGHLALLAETIISIEGPGDLADAVVRAELAVDVVRDRVARRLGDRLHNIVREEGEKLMVERKFSPVQELSLDHPEELDAMMQFFREEDLPVQ